MHYQQDWHKRNPIPGKPAPICAVEGCSIKQRRGIYCATHFRRFEKYGDPLITRRTFSWRNDRLQQTWHNINQRCSNPIDRKFKYYGGKGIQNLLTREELQFLWERDGAALMNRPSIDRKDTEGHYTFENCRFIEHVENIKNGWKSSPARKTGKHFADNDSMSVDEVSEYLRTSNQTVYKMLANEQIPGAFRVGNRWRVTKRAFLEKMGER